VNPFKLVFQNSNGGLLKIQGKRRRAVKLSAIHQPHLFLIAGILILVMPGFSNLIVAIYSVITGILGTIHGKGRILSP
jgi:hypothetical protein